MPFNNAAERSLRGIAVGRYKQIGCVHCGYLVANLLEQAASSVKKARRHPPEGAAELMRRHLVDAYERVGKISKAPLFRLDAV
jgi:hypothetical protein